MPRAQPALQLSIGHGDVRGRHSKVHKVCAPVPYQHASLGRWIWLKSLEGA